MSFMGMGLAASRACPRGKEKLGACKPNQYRKDAHDDVARKVAEDIALRTIPGRPTCFLDVSIGGARQGRIIIELFSDIAPRTAENFRLLCRGTEGNGCRGKPLHYKGCNFHRVVPNFIVQAGDFTKFDGTGGESVYGLHFDDENFLLRHSRAGLVSMANSGPNRNGSQFFITLKPNSSLDGKHTVFGRVIDGMDAVKRIEACGMQGEAGPMKRKVDELISFYTTKEAFISDCGELETVTDFAAITDDPRHSALVIAGDVSGAVKRRRVVGDGKGELKEARLFHLVKKHADSKWPETWRGHKVTCTKGKAKVAVENARKRLMASGSLQQAFVEIARDLSDDASAQRGGDLGMVERGMYLDAEVEDCAFALNPGELTEVFETGQGFHLLFRLS